MELRFFCARCTIPSHFTGGKLPFPAAATVVWPFSGFLCLYIKRTLLPPSSHDAKRRVSLLFLQLFGQTVPWGDVHGGVHLIQHHAGLGTVGLPDVLHLGGASRMHWGGI